MVGSLQKDNQAPTRSRAHWVCLLPLPLVRSLICVRCCPWGPVTTPIKVHFPSLSIFKGQITHLSNAFPQTVLGSRGGGIWDVPLQLQKVGFSSSWCYSQKHHSASWAKVPLAAAEAMTRNTCKALQWTISIPNMKLIYPANIGTL